MNLKVYRVVRNGVELTMQLTEADAKAAGAKLVEEKAARPANKAAKVANRAAPAADK